MPPRSSTLVCNVVFIVFAAADEIEMFLPAEHLFMSEPNKPPTNAVPSVALSQFTSNFPNVYRERSNSIGPPSSLIS